MPTDTDARVEVLLVLGIIFWCWLLILFCQKEDRTDSRQLLALSWNGTTLSAKPQQSMEVRDWMEGCALPARFTPFFFLPIPVNSADAELLATIPGIGPGLAAKIIATRTTKGPFRSPPDLLQVPGIGPSRMSRFAPRFSFAVNDE